MTRVVVVAAVLVTVLAEAVALTLSPGSRVVPASYALYALTQVAAGALVLWRHPRHPIGWLLVGFAVLNAVVADAALAYGQRAAGTGWPGGEYAELAALLSWIVAAPGLWGLFLLLPDGRLLARGWLAVPVAWTVGAVLAVPGWALDPRLGSEFASGSNPFAREDLPTGALFAVGATLVSASVVASVVAMLVRFRRARGVERQQLLWVLLAAAVLAVVLPLAVLLWTAWPPIQVVTALAFPLLPAAACVALLRHRLYDVELVVSTAATWALLTVLLAGGYAAVVLLAGLVLSSPLAAAVAALCLAIAFRPVHLRCQDAVDRRFRRRRYEARDAMARFVDDVRRGRLPADGVEHALQVAVGDRDLLLHLGRGDVVPDGRARMAVGQARISHRVEDTELVAAAADAGRLAIDVAALQAELRLQVAELERSRSRIAAAAEDERRRIARDLHDGAQQRLVAIGLDLRHVQHLLGPTAPVEVGAGLDSAVRELAQSVGDLRALAGGLRPAALEAGLRPALRDLAARVDVPTTVTVPEERFRPDVESVVWFVACEAVTNAVKHSGACHLAVALRHDADVVVLTVTDDGRGGAAPGRGSGLVGLTDRLRARGGALSLDSPRGGGTRVEARVPCG